MTERFEFIDGSFYEFERLSKPALKSIQDRNVRGAWYVNLGKRVEGRCEVIDGEPEVYFQPVDDVRLWGSFGDCYRAHREKKTSSTKKKLSDNVIAVGLSFDSLGSILCPDEFRRGVYLPIMFDFRLPGDLFIDIADIVSRVIYEPSLITPETRKALRSRS